MRRHLAALALIFAGWSAAETTTLTVLYTSDLHGRLLPYDEVRQRALRGSVAQAATLISRVRAENSRTIVVDGGDTLQGSALTHIVLASPGADVVDPTIAALNLVGYDAAVLGNHEFNYGLPPLRRALSQSKFPWLAANLGGTAAAGLPVSDAVILDKGGVRVAVLGLTNPNVPHWDLPERWMNLIFRDPVAEAEARLATLRARADVVIVVAHTGFERSLETGNEDGSSAENFGWRLAQVPGIDLLLTGHTHRDLRPQRVGATVVAQPGRWGEIVTRVDFELERRADGWAITEWRGANLPTQDEAPSEAVLAAVDPARARVEGELARVLGELTAPLSLGGVPTTDDPAIDLVHAAQLAASGAQLSLASPLGSSATEFPAGPLTPRLAHALYPYPNSLVVVRITGRQLKDVLEHAVAGWIGVECQAGLPCSLRRDRQRPGYNFDTLEGADYAIDPAAPRGERVAFLRVAGRLVRDDDRFTLVINSYRAAGGGSYPHLATAERVATVDRPMTEILVEYFQRQRRITPEANGNWVFTLPMVGVVAAPAGGVK